MTVRMQHPVQPHSAFAVRVSWRNMVSATALCASQERARPAPPTEPKPGARPRTKPLPPTKPKPAPPVDVASKLKRPKVRARQAGCGNGKDWHARPAIVCPQLHTDTGYPQAERRSTAAELGRRGRRSKQEEPRHGSAHQTELARSRRFPSFLTRWP